MLGCVAGPRPTKPNAQAPKPKWAQSQLGRLGSDAQARYLAAAAVEVERGCDGWAEPQWSPMVAYGPNGVTTAVDGTPDCGCAMGVVQVVCLACGHEMGWMCCG